MPSEFDVLFPMPENRRNADDMGMPSPVRDEKISQNEMREMFGDMIPMEAVSIIWDGDGSKTVAQARAELRALSVKIKGWRISRDDLEGWLNELGTEAEGRDYDERYKFGFTMALVAVRQKMDDARKGYLALGQ